jgi:transcriptional regulator with XRE-family HTH domain
MAATEFGQAVRRWRERLRPEAAGLPSGGQRRAPGLRREELAQLARISVDYVTRLEQGRAIGPSAQVVEALARALRLGAEERAHLFRLAGLAAPGHGVVPVHVTPGVQRLVDRLVGAAVAVYDAAWNVIRVNALWSALMGDPGSLRGPERNVVWRYYFAPLSRISHTDEQKRAFESAMAADLRAAMARYPADRKLAELISQLRGSSRFARVWDSGVVTAHESARKTIHHPEVGALTLDCDVLTVPGSDLRIVAYTAEPGTDACDRLTLLGVVGQQTFAW